MKRKQLYNQQIWKGEAIGVNGKAIQRRQRRKPTWQTQSTSAKEKETHTHLGRLINLQILAQKHPH